MKVIRKIDDGWHYVERWFGIILLSVIILVVFLQVLNNSVIHSPKIVWTEEVTKISLIWFIMVCSSIAIREGTQLNVDVLVNKFKGTTRFIIDIIVILFCIATFAALCKSGWFLFTGYIKKGTSYGITRCPYWVSALALPLWFASDTIRSIILLIYRISDFKKEKKGELNGEVKEEAAK